MLLNAFAVLLSFLALGMGQDILESPANQTVPLGSNATVSCRTDGLLTWSVTTPETASAIDISTDLIGELAERGIYILTDTLGSNATLEHSSKVVITGTRENNGTVLYCKARVKLMIVESNPGVVLVFGPPAPPTDLTAHVVAPLQLNLSWDKPFALPGVVITYLVNAENLDMYTAEFNSEEIHSTHYIFEASSHPCVKYQFSVVAVNTAGRSERSQEINMSIPALPDIAVELFTQLVYIEDQVVWVEITFEAVQMCIAYPVANYSLTLNNVVTGRLVLLGPYFPAQSGTVTISVNTLDDNMDENVHYAFNLSALNVVGSASFNSGEFYTTDVQLAEYIVLNDGTIKIKCHFAQGSQALGCSVELVSPEDSVLWNITREIESLVAERNITTPLPAHSYNISVFDLERDGTVGEVDILVVEAEQDEGYSSDHGSGNGVPPSETETENGVQFGAIVGGVIGSVAIISITLVLLLTVVIYKRQPKPGPVNTEVNVAYEMPSVPRPSTNTHIRQGNESSVSPTHEYEEVPVSFRDVLQSQMISEGYLYDNDEDITPQTNPSYVHMSLQQTL